MGILDSDSVFNILDPARRGYLTVDQVHQFDETLHFSPLGIGQLRAGVAQVCGAQNDGKVYRQQFMQVKVNAIRLTQFLSKLLSCTWYIIL